MATLLVDIPMERLAFDVDEAGATVGRGQACAVRLAHPTLSREHARLFEKSGRWWVEDLDSRNGVFLNGRRVRRGPAALPDGCRLRFGSLPATFRSRDDALAPPTRDDRRWRGAVGVTARCPCGANLWAHERHADELLTCPACGASTLVGATPAKAEAPVGTCAACHADVGAREARVACAQCGATHHQGCYDELGGCANFGCAGAAAPAEEEEEVVELEVEPSAAPATAAVALAGLAGLLTFGVPPVALAIASPVWRALHAPRTGTRVAACIVGGIAGALFSGWWYFA